MTDEYVTMKIDAGLLMRKIEEWKLKNFKQFSSTEVDPDIMLSASLNNDKAEGDSQPLYKGRSVAVWHNKVDKKQGQD